LKKSCGLSDREIASSLGHSRSAVWDCLKRASIANISWPLDDDIEDSALYDRLYHTPEKSVRRPIPNCEYIFAELKRKGVTLSLLWEEYKRDNENGYQYTQFCDYYRDWVKLLNPVMRHEHRAGHKCFSDFSGGSLKITDPSTGLVSQAILFVCTLGASKFTYAELFWSESAESWCNGQARAFEYFQGTSELVIPDNPKAVITKASAYEPDINRDFLRLAKHFDVAVLPARVRKPKDKALVEAAVGLATRWILARLRNQKFFSLAEANATVQELLDDLNNRPFRKLQHCRRSLFELVDKPALKPLPQNKFEYGHIEIHRAGKDYMVTIDGCLYSVPHQLTGKRIEALISTSTVEFLFNNRRVASHPKCSCALPGQLHRKDEHMPQSHRAFHGYSKEFFIDSATKIGPSTAEFVHRLFEKAKAPELAFRSCFGIFRLAKLHGVQRVERACKRASVVGSYSYKTVRLILQNKMDTRPLPTTALPVKLVGDHENIRGAKYFAQKQENQNVNSSNVRQSENPEIVRHGQRLSEPITEPGTDKPAV
jgi:transposase